MPIQNSTDRADYTHWLQLYLVRGVSPRGLTQLLAAFKTPEAIHAASAHELAKHIGPAVAQAIKEGPPEDELSDHLDWIARDNNHLITFAEPDYPKALLLTSDPPPLFFAKGQRALLQSPACVAVVGSRNASPQGQRDAAAFAKILSGAGVTIVSGLALGIDAAAHQGALDGLQSGLAADASEPGEFSGSTIAVVGTGLDRIYPARNAALAREIAEKGLVISEFALGTPPLRENFPRRNRIISGLAKGVLVVEASLGSGSLITARLAGEQGRDVYAIPGSIHSPLSKGCHSLIKSGAKLVETAEDVLSELQIEPKVRPSALIGVKKSAIEKPEEASEIAAQAAADQPHSISSKLLATLAAQSLTLDQLCAALGEPTHVVMAELTTLELLGKVASTSGGRFQQLF